jgi:RimJ/RimL family protein N-acetyltransferase
MNGMMVFRPATVNDSGMLLEWRNDELTRKSSINSDFVTAEEHFTWLNRTIVNPNRKLFIAEIECVPVGMIRFDRVNEQFWELSWNVAPHSRGKGIGKEMVKLSTSLVPEDLIARIKTGNLASLGVADYAGFQFDGEQDGLKTFVMRKKKS